MQELYDDMIPGITDHQARYAKELAASLSPVCGRRVPATGAQP